MLYYQARWEDPVLGRFTQPDTIIPDPGNPLSLDRYAYTSNNPVKYIDPTGHYACDGLECALPDSYEPPKPRDTKPLKGVSVGIVCGVGSNCAKGEGYSNNPEDPLPFQMEKTIIEAKGGTVEYIPGSWTGTPADLQIIETGISNFIESNQGQYLFLFCHSFGGNGCVAALHNSPNSTVGVVLLDPDLVDPSRGNFDTAPDSQKAATKISNTNWMFVGISTSGVSGVSEVPTPGSETLIMDLANPYDTTHLNLTNDVKLAWDIVNFMLDAVGNDMR